jgi:hypothetical protein
MAYDSQNLVWIPCFLDIAICSTDFNIVYLIPTSTMRKESKA